MFGWIKFLHYLNWVTIQKTIACAIQQRLTGFAAEMAFHATLGLFPAIVAILTAIGLFDRSVESKLVNLAVYFAHIVPIQVWSLLLDFIESVKESETKGWLYLSSIAAIWIISGVLSAAIAALDGIHRVVPEKRRSYLQTKLLAISLTVLTIIFLIIACFLLWVGDLLLQLASWQNWNSLLLSVWESFSAIAILTVVSTTLGLVYQVQTKLDKRRERERRSTIIFVLVILASGISQLIYLGYRAVQEASERADLTTTLSNLLIGLWRFLGFPIALGIIAIAFTAIYRYGARERIKNTPILPGAILAAISWAVVSSLFRLYVLHIGIYSRLYGAAGTAVILMLWLYLTSLVMLIGEQLNVVIGEARMKDSYKLVD